MPVLNLSKFVSIIVPIYLNLLSAVVHIGCL
jgi:hypothetical protein